jgi:secretion/DNA translocation related TadE-like protein
VVSPLPRHEERGAGSVLAVAMMGLLVTVTVAAAGVVGVVATHRAAQSAADLAALAGASALQDGGDACERAAAVAGRNRASLTQCAVNGWDVSVVVTAESAHLPGGVLELEAQGRAGPAVSGTAP